MAMAPAGERRPDHVFVAPSRARSAVAVLMLLSLVGAVAGVWWGWREGSSTAYVLACGAAVAAVACWVLLQVSVPQRITITGSVVEVRRQGATQRYDLEDPGTDLLVRDGEVAFGIYRDSWTIVRARDVDWRPFMDVVMRYQSRADHNAEERDKRFSR